MTTLTNGYSRTSIIAHWIAAIAVISLFFTHEGERGRLMRDFHIGVGAIIGVFLIWRAIRRPLRGFADKPDQPALLNLVSQIVLWGLLACILVATISGYFLPWSGGRPLDIFGLIQIPSPITGTHDLNEFFEFAHEISGTGIMPLVGLHILGALKHFLFDKDNVMNRIIKPVSGGR